MGHEFLLYIQMTTTEPDPARELEKLRRERDNAVASYDALVDFVTNLSHELKTPLNGVLGMAQLLSGTNLSAEQDGYVRSIRLSCDHMRNVITDVLELSRLEAGTLPLEPAPVLLREVVDEVVSILQPGVKEKHLFLEGRVDPALNASLLIDGSKLRQILLNLAGNAVKFTESGGVKIMVERVSGDRKQTTLLFKVIDTGVGISERNLTRLFKRFSRIEEVGKEGTGLGLAISRQLVELMGGSIGVQSAAGSGSQFWFRLTLKNAENVVPIEPSNRPVAVASARSSLRLLLADDNQLNQLFVSTLLRKGGHEVTLVSDGRGAVNAVREGSFDAVLMDIHMPNLNGFEALECIRRLPGQRSRIPVIALTADGSVGGGQELIEAGMSDYVPKPIDVEALSDALQRCTGRPVKIPGINVDVGKAPATPSLEAEAAVSDFLASADDVVTKSS
jgi:CheY-like chemotaxis protein/nitrogen-specific signal transduction histidine kinase